MDLGRLVATLQMVGAKAAARDLQTVDTAFDGTAKAADKAAASSDAAADAQDGAAKAAQRNADAQEEVASATKKGAAASEQSADAAKASAKGQEAAGDAAKRRAAQEEAAARKAAQNAAEVRDAQREIGAALATTGAVVLATVGASIAKYAEFDQAMSGVRATVRGTQEDNEALRDSAIAAGGATSYSATEAANAQNELAKAGVQVKDILGGGLAGSLSLAAAGQMGVADAAEVAATALVQFNLRGSEVPHVADLLAAGAGKAQGSVGDLGSALKQSGLVASQMGLSIEETTGTLSAFASAGLMGSDAGTSFKTMLLALANPSSIAAAAMDKYKISAYDANGEMVSMADLAGQLESKLGGLSQAERDKAMATIFGSDAIRAANVLYTQGYAGIVNWTEKVNDAGYAARQAAELQDNLAGDTEKLGGAFDTAFIQSGAAANDVMRDMVQMLTFLVNAYAGLPPGMQQVVLGGAAVVGSIGLIGGAALLAIPKIAELKLALSTLNTKGTGSMGALKGIGGFLMGPWGIALSAAAIGLGVFIDQQAKAAQRTEEFRNSLDSNTGALTDYTTDLVEQNLAARDSFLWMEKDSAYDAAKKVGVGLQEVTDAASGNVAAYESIKAAYTAFLQTNPSMGDPQLEAWDSLYAKVTENRDSMAGAKEQVAQMGEASAAAATQQDTMAAATGGLGQSFDDASLGAEDVTTALEGLVEQMDAYNQVGQNVVQSNADFLLGLDGLKGQVDQLKSSWNANHDANNQWKQGLDQSTASGAQQAAMLAEQAQKAADSAAATYELDKTTMSSEAAMQKYSGTLAGNRDKLIAAAAAAGYNKDEVRALIDTILAVPSEKATKLTADTARAQSAVSVYLSALNQIPGYKETVINQVIKQTGAARGDVAAAYNADGGVYQAATPGAVVRHYANGGIENHAAQFAHAGKGATVRIWAENETGGETYIPHAMSKRGQSTQQLAQTADIFGYDLVPKGSQPQARGEVNVTFVNPVSRNAAADAEEAADILRSV